MGPIATVGGRFFDFRQEALWESPLRVCLLIPKLYLYL
jgi:hypothetical protein